MARRHREILDTLLARIVDGEYPVGSLLPKEEMIREEFDVSRGTGREALRALEERRVAVVRHGRGAIVQPPEVWNVLDPVVAAALSRGRRRRRFLEEVEELRGVLRAEAAALAAQRASARERDAILAAAARAATAPAAGRSGSSAGRASSGSAAARRGSGAAATRAAADSGRGSDDPDVWTLVLEAAENRPLAAALRTLADLAPDEEEGGDATLAEAVAAGDIRGAREAARGS